VTTALDVKPTRRLAATTDKAWNGDASRFSDEEYKRSCLIDRGPDFSDSIKERCSLPVLEPDGTINTNALASAAGRIGQVKNVSADQLAKAKSKLRSLYEAAGMDLPEGLGVGMADALPRHELLLALGELETVDVPDVEILSTGGPYFGTGSPPEGDTFNETFLSELATANTVLASQVKVPIKIGHSKSQKLLTNSGLASGDTLGSDEQPAAGWLENFRVVGDKLLADAKGVPKKIADLMKARAFRSRSVEMSRVVEQTPDGAGREFPAVVTALALLGAKAPAVRTLDDILAWYGESGKAAEYLAADMDDDAEAERSYAVDVAWDPEGGVQDLMSDIAAALNGPAPYGSMMPSRYWVCDLSLDDGGNSGTALVNDSAAEDTDTAWLVPFTIGDDGEPTPAPSNKWTLASQKYVKQSTDNAQAALGDRSDPVVATSRKGADTLGMSETATAPELTDDKVVEFAATFGIDETDPAKRRDAVLAEFKKFAGETPAPAPEPTDPPTPTPTEPTPPAAHEDPRIAALEARAALGERAFEERRMERRDANIKVAIRQGRISPADKPKWERFFDDNEELALDALCTIPAQPRRTYGSDETGQVEYAETVGRGYDAAYASLAGALGIRPVSLPTGGQS
jgi:hypothetical protein